MGGRGYRGRCGVVLWAEQHCSVVHRTLCGARAWCPCGSRIPLDCCCCCVIVSGAGTQCGAHPVSGAESDVDVPSSTRCARGFFPRGVHREPCPGGHPRCVRGQGLCTARRCCVSVTMKWGRGEGRGALGGGLRVAWCACCWALVARSLPHMARPTS